MYCKSGIIILWMGFAIPICQRRYCKSSQSTSLFLPIPILVYQSGADSTEMTVFHGESRTPNICKTISFLERVTVNGVRFSKFLVEGRHSGTNVTPNSFQQFRYDFDMVYLNDNDEEIRRNSKTVTINIKDC